MDRKYIFLKSLANLQKIRILALKKKKKLFGMTPLKDLIPQVFNYSLSANSLGNLVDTF